jgi:hypothetical protein
MLSRILFSFFIAACAAFNVSAITFTVKPDSGVILVWQQSNGRWTAVKDSINIVPGDSLYLDDQYHSKLFLGKGCALYLRGELRANIEESDTSLRIHCDQGQVFLKREPGAELAAISVVLRKCIFTPVGTAAAIKFTKQGEPTVAVLSGKVKIEPPKGEPLVVGPGNFGIYDPVAAAFKQGKLSPEAIAGLESWSGTKFDQAAPAAGSADTVRQAVDETSQKSSLPAVSAPAPAAAPEKKEEEPAASVMEEKKEPSKGGNAAPGITWELSAGSVTVGDEQWIRLAFSPDIPIWKFGICFDVELFVNARGDFSDKGWAFDRDRLAESLMRKIRYLRFGYENEPVFVKIGGLSSVTLGYGFVMDRFTNMLHYPDQKLLGAQFYLTNISPVGITLQTMVSDLLEFKYKGGIGAARLALTPLKLAGIPILSDLSIGATYGIDVNEYAPSRAWKAVGDPRDRNNNGVFDAVYWRNKYAPAFVDTLVAHGDADTSTFTIDTTYRDSLSRYAVLGGDFGVPIITTDFLGLDVYGQAAVVADTVMFKQNRTGWGIGAPGVALRAGPVNARIEYRHIRGRFIPGYFGPYYYDERLQRYPKVETRSQSMTRKDLDGVFGTFGFNIVNIVMIDGTYQYLRGKNSTQDQRLELSAGVGDALLKRVPKITKAEAYFYKTDIGSTIMDMDAAGVITYDRFFGITPAFYYGCRIGIAITQGASLIGDARFGYKWGENHKLVPNNNVGIQTAITF